jgi:hypothetical protein
MPWRYPPEWLGVLADLGIAPARETPPRLVRDHLNDLYRLEIRRLKQALLAHAFPKSEYVGRVIELRRKYWPLSFTPDQWERICADDDA